MQQNETPRDNSKVLKHLAAVWNYKLLCLHCGWFWLQRVRVSVACAWKTFILATSFEVSHVNICSIQTASIRGCIW